MTCFFAPQTINETFPYSTWGIIVFMGCIIAVLEMASGHRFALGNMTSIGNEVAVLSLISLGFLVVFYVNEYDLSVGSTFALSLMIAALAQESMPAWSIGLVVFALVVLIGLINGLTTVMFNVALIVTFTMMFALRGIVYLMSDGMPVTITLSSPSSALDAIGWGSIAGIPISVWLVCAVVIGLEVFFRRSLAGRTLVAIGIDSQRAHDCGLPLRPYKIGAFVFAAVMAGIASVVYFSRLQTVSPNLGSGFPFDALAIVIISNGGIARLQPSPTRVLVVTVLLLWIKTYVEFLGQLPDASDLVTGALVLATLLISKVCHEKPSPQHEAFLTRGTPRVVPQTFRKQTS